MLKQDSPKRVDQGQSLVEFSISLAILLLLLGGLVDLGRLYLVYITLEDIAGEAVLFLSLNPQCITEADCGADNNVYDRAKNAAPDIIDWDNRVSMEPPISGTGRIGDPVIISLAYRFQFVMPVWPFGGNEITINASANGVVLQNPSS